MIVSASLLKEKTMEPAITFMVLETGAVIFTVLVAMEMHRQQLSSRSVLIGSLVVLGTLTAMIVMWRGR
jgi:ABC-type cobalamin transport system permease subunit